MKARRASIFSAPAVAVAFVFVSLPTRAATRLDYAAPEGCATEADFTAAVEARGGQFDSTSPGEGTVMDVSVGKADDAFHGSIRVRRNGDASSLREVHGATCAEVIDALAIVTAIVLRQEAKNAQPAKPEPAPPPPEKPRPPPLQASGNDTWPTPFQTGRKSIRVEAGTVRFEPSANVTAFGGVVLGVIPSVVMPRYDLTLERANFVAMPSGSSYLVGPVFRFRASFLGEGTYHSPGFSTHVTGEAVSLSPCYSPVYDVGGFELLFCLDVGVSVVNMRTKNASGAATQSKNTGLGTIGFGTEATYNLGRYLQIAAKLGADGSTNPLTAERPDGSQIFHSSWLSGYGMLGFGAHW